VSEIECNAVLWWCYDFPHAILVSRVQFWETWTRYGAIRDIKYTTTGICNMRSICVMMAVQTPMCYMTEIMSGIWNILYTEEFSHTFTMLAIRMKFKSDSARTLITS
jgi:hypothetical protein